jgi:hypothetical protein
VRGQRPPGIASSGQGDDPSGFRNIPANPHLRDRILSGNEGIVDAQIALFMLVDCAPRSSTTRWPRCDLWARTGGAR